MMLTGLCLTQEHAHAKFRSKPLFCVKFIRILLCGYFYFTR